jgi:outer membrane protein TolC
MKNLILVLMVAFSINAVSQNIDYNKIILPQGSSDIEFEEKLVQLAWKNLPDVAIAKKQVRISELDEKLSRRKWLENFRIAGNLNEFNVDPSRDINNRSQFLPRYNFSLGFPLGQLFTNPVENKQALINRTIAEDQVNSLKLQLRNEVLTAYNNYKTQEEVYKIQKIAMDNAETNHAIIEKSFEQGEETFERYDNSLNNLSQRRINLLQSERELRNTRYIVEQYIGMSLDNVE